MKTQFSITTPVFNLDEPFSHVQAMLYQIDMDGVQKEIGVKSVTVPGQFSEITSELIDIVAKQLYESGLISKPVTELEAVKAERWAAVTRIRDGLETKGFPYMDKWFDSDERSVQRINTTAQAAMAAKSLGQQFDTVWTAADNAGVPMTVDQVIGLPVALALHANELHTKARDLRERINSAQTIMEVMQCYWEGYEKMPVGALPLN